MKAVAGIFGAVVLVGTFLVLLSVDQVAVCDEAQSEVVAGADLVHTVHGGTNGRTSFEILYLVLDLGSSKADAAVQEQGRRMKAVGWTVTPDESGLVGDSARWDTTAWVRTLGSYLAQDHLDHDPQEVGERFGDQHHLIVVTMEQNSYDSPCSWLPLWPS